MRGVGNKPHPSFHIIKTIMYKTYQAGSDLAFNIMVEGKPRRIVFEPQSHGTSMYSTRDTKEQKGLETHYWFGDKFRILSEIDEEKLATEAKKKARAQAKKSAEELKTHLVEDIQEAKDYLADEFGVSRSKMKTKEDIMAVAKEHGITLEGLS